MLINRISLLIPLLIPVFYSRQLQDCFLFPKEMLFMVLCGLSFSARIYSFMVRGENKKAFFHFNDLLYGFLIFLCALSIHRVANFYVPLSSLVLILSAALIYYEFKIFNRFDELFGIYSNLFLISSAAASIFALFQYYKTDFIFEGAPYLDKMRMFSFFGNKNYLSEFLVVIFFLSLAKILALISFNKMRFISRFYGLKLFLFSASLILTGTVIFILQSRASFIALAAGMIMINSFFMRNHYAQKAVYKKILTIVLIAAIFLSLLAVYSIKTPLTNETTDLFQRAASVFDIAGRNAAIRFDIWHATYKMISDNFWWGCGLSYFKMNYLSYQGMLLRESNVMFFENHFFARANQAHNEFLQIFSELGVFAFIAVLIFVVYFLALYKRLIDFNAGRSDLVRGMTVSCLGAGIVSVFINSMFGFPLHVLPTAVILIFTLAIIEKLLMRAEEKGAKAADAAFYYEIIPSKINVFAVCVSGAIFYAMTFFMMPSYIAANINMKAGLDYLKLEMPERAMPHLKKSIAINPYSGETRYYLGVCHLQKKEYDLGILELIQALDSEADPNIFSNIGLAYYRIGMYGEALEYLKKAIEMSPNDIYYLLNAGCAEQRLKNYESALSYFQKALSYAVTPEAYINVGHVYLLMNMPDKGAGILGDALNRFGQLNPRYLERINYLMGLCMGEMGKYGEGISYLSRARAVTPRNPDYSLNIGLFQIYSGKTAEAELTFKKQLEIDFSGIVAYNLANLYFNSFRFDDAIMTLEQVKKSLEVSGGRENRLYEETLHLIKLAKQHKGF